MGGSRARFARASRERADLRVPQRVRINLHLFLYEGAQAKASAGGEAAGWREALDYYRREMVKNDLLSEKMAAIGDRLSRLEDGGSAEGAGFDPELAGVLERGAPVYRQRWWGEHDRGNLAWIEAVKPLVVQFGDVLKKEIAAAYKAEWPAAPIRADVAEFAGWAGAYTAVEPTHITISSTDAGYRGFAALEMLFHEASHSISGIVEETLAAELKAQNRLFRRRQFAHAVIFYTAGEFVRRLREGYTPYAIQNGVYDRGWPGALPVLEKDWRPYLDGEIDLKEAARRVAADYGVAAEGRG